MSIPGPLMVTAICPECHDVVSVPLTHFDTHTQAPTCPLCIDDPDRTWVRSMRQRAGLDPGRPSAPRQIRIRKLR